MLLNWNSSFEEMSAKIFKTHGLSKTSQLLCKLQTISTAKPLLSVSVNRLHIRSVENQANKYSIKQLLFQKHKQHFSNEACETQAPLRKFCSNIDKQNSRDHSNVAQKVIFSSQYFIKNVRNHRVVRCYLWFYRIVFYFLCRRSFSFQNKYKFI